MFLCSPASLRSCALALAIASALGALTTSEANAWELPVVDLKIGLRGGANIAYTANPPDSDQLYQYPFTLADSADPEPRYGAWARSRAVTQMLSSIGSVSRPVNVFCLLGW